MAFDCNLSYEGGVSRQIMVEAILGKDTLDPIWKLSRAKRDCDLAQVPTCKLKVLSSNLGIVNK
jgi:hypothetical protein